MSRPAPQLPTPAAIDFGAPSAERDIERGLRRPPRPGRPAGVPFLGPHQARRLNLAAARRFQVHPMFRAYLGAGQA
jgi:hypothetical protein